MDQLRRLVAAFRDAVRERKVLVESETAWFILASVLDFGMTFILLTRDEDQATRFRESNPVALFFLNHWGIKGLFAFKLVIVLIVVAICQIIAHHKLILAQRVLYLSTAIVAAVVIYSMFLHKAHSTTDSTKHEQHQVTWKQRCLAHQGICTGDDSSTISQQSRFA